ncbi:MAG: hypothetical protein ACYDAO_02175 [Thermoplasmataceae archaeon]
MPELKFYSVSNEIFYTNFLKNIDKINFVYCFSLNYVKCTEQIIEAYRRSENPIKRRIHNKGAIFLCLLSGTPRIEDALSRSGLNETSRFFGAITENAEHFKEFELLFKGMIFEEPSSVKERCKNLELQVYSSMTLTDFTLQ